MPKRAQWAPASHVESTIAASETRLKRNWRDRSTTLPKGLSLFFSLSLLLFYSLTLSLFSLLFTLYSLLFTLYSLLFTLYSLLFTLYSLLFTLYSLLFTLYSLLFTLYSLLFTLYSLLFTLYSLLFTLYSLLFTLYSLLFTLYSLLFTLYSLLLLLLLLITHVPFEPHRGIDGAAHLRESYWQTMFFWRRDLRAPVTEPEYELRSTRTAFPFEHSCGWWSVEVGGRRWKAVGQLSRPGRSCVWSSCACWLHTHCAHYQNLHMTRVLCEPHRGVHDAARHRWSWWQAVFFGQREFRAPITEPECELRSGPLSPPASAVVARHLARLSFTP